MKATTKRGIKKNAEKIGAWFLALVLLGILGSTGLVPEDITFPLITLTIFFPIIFLGFTSAFKATFPYDRKEIKKMLAEGKRKRAKEMAAPPRS